MRENAKIFWKYLEKDAPEWSDVGCLYAYLTPDKKEILYIGKSWSVSVKKRWNRDAKADFWNSIEKKRGIKTHIVLHGAITLAPRKRLTDKLLSDIESLLIMAEQPWGNVQSKSTRRPRLGYIVKCSGSWPGVARYYKDGNKA